jgi:ElaB/YqjD/DUF883 family membrane-anchored ribosome-binding protein
MKEPNENNSHPQTENTPNEAAHVAADIRTAASDVAREIRGRFEEIAGDFKGKASGWQKELEQYVKKNPTKSLLTAVGVGFVLGVICRR